MAGVTRSDLRTRLSRLLGGYYTGVATSGSTTTCLDTSSDSQLIQPDNSHINHYLFLRTDADGNGTNISGEVRPISDFVQSTQTITVSPAFSSAVETADTFDIFKYPPFLLDEAVEHGLRKAWPFWYREVRDITTLDTTTDQHYDVPDYAAKVLSVRILSSDGYSETPIEYWRVEGTPGDMKLYTLLDQSSGYNLSVIYLEYPRFLTSTGGAVTTAASTDVVGVSVAATGADHTYAETCGEYAVYAAAEYVLQPSLDDGSDNAKKAALNRVQLYREKQREMEVTRRMPAKSAPVAKKPWPGRGTTFG